MVGPEASLGAHYAGLAYQRVALVAAEGHQNADRIKTLGVRSVDTAVDRWLRLLALNRWMA